MSTSAIALLLADARTPSGSYAHSAGVEPAVAGGLDGPGLPAFLRGRLQTVAFTEAVLTAHAARAETLAALLELDAEARARCVSPPLRDASAALGRGMLRTGATLFDAGGLLRDYRAASTWTPRPIALGVVAAAGGVGARDAALVALHDDIATAASAAIKLLPVDAAASSAWVARLAPELETLADRAAAATDLPSASAPLIDRRSLVHAQDRRRLFAS